MQTRRAGVEAAGDLQSLVQAGSLVGLCEEELLVRFVEGKDARAFEFLLERHGPMVLGVCRNLLADPNDVEDAFQATFFLLIRKGSTIRRPGSLAAWLHGVAHRTALRLRRSARTIRLMTDPVERSRPCPIEDREQIVQLHREIESLPEKYRLPIILCYLEGLTHDDVAARLRWPVGTVRGRLARARDRLRKRLSRTGVELFAGFPRALERVCLTPDKVPGGLLRSTTTLLEHTASLRVSTLTRGVVLAMIFDKLKWTLATLTVAAVILVGAGVGLRAFASQHEPTTPQRPGHSGAARVQVVKAEGTQVAAEREKAADQLEEHRTEAELLEMETSALASSIKRNIESIKQIETTPNLGSPAGINDKTASISNSSRNEGRR